MNVQPKMIIVANDLNSMAQRIEDLPAHPRLTEALVAVQQAEKAVREAAGDLHHRDMLARHAAA